MAAIFAGGSFALQLWGMNEAANANKEDTAFRAEMARHSKEVADMMAADAIFRGEQAVKAQERTIKQVVGAQRAGVAASGFVVDEGTAADVVAETTKWGNVDVQTIRANAANEANVIRAGGIEALSQAAYTAQTNRNRTEATLITGAANLANLGYNYYRDRG